MAFVSWSRRTSRGVQLEFEKSKRSQEMTCRTYNYHLQNEEHWMMSREGSKRLSASGLIIEKLSGDFMDTFKGTFKDLGSRE